MGKKYTLYEQKMYRLAYSIVYSEEQAEDIVQESFIKIFSHIDEIKIVDSQATKYWILRIVKNEAIDVYRRNKRTLELNDIVKKDQSVVAYSNVENKLQQMMQKEYLQKILNQLSHSDKEILQYKHFYELSTAEIANMLNITEDGVRKRYSRAKQRAKELAEGTRFLYDRDAWRSEEGVTAYNHKFPYQKNNHQIQNEHHQKSPLDSTADF